MAELPTLDLSVIPGTQPVPPRQAAGDAVNQLDGELSRLTREANDIALEADSITTGLGQEIVRGLFRQKFGVVIKTPQERADDALIASIRRQDLMRRDATFKLDSVFATFLGSADEINADPDIRAQGIKVDEKLLERPEEFLRLAQMSGIQGIDKGTLYMAGVKLTTKEDRARTAAETQLKDRERTLASEEAATGLLKLTEEFTSGRSALFKLIEQQVERAGQAADVDLTDFDTEIDEDKGSAVFLDNLPQMFRTARAGGLQPPEFVPLLLASEFGQDIRDQLDEVPRDPDGNIISGQGHAGATPRAVFNLLTSLAKMAQVSGIPLESVMRQVGANGIELSSFREYGDEVARQSGYKDHQEYLAEFGLSVNQAQ